MKRIGVVTRKGQVTIPVEMRRALGLEEGDRVWFTFEKDRLTVEAVGSITDLTAGMFKHEGPPLSAEELREAAAQAIADSAMERSGL